MRGKIILGLAAMLLTLTQLSAQRINIGFIYPAGAQRGTSTTISIGGQSISSAAEVIISGEGITAEVLPASEQPKVTRRKKSPISDEDNLQLAQTLKVKVTIAADAPLGVRDLKLVSRTGVVSNMLFFEVGDYADFVEKEPNNIVAEANHIETLPVTINGYVEKSSVSGSMERSGGGMSIERGGKDFFSFDAKKGEMLVAEVKARIFVPYLADAVPGWFQSVISIYDESGREVAYCDDFRLRVDPVIMYRVEHTGRYYIKIHDSIYRGREDFVYRINLGVIPFVSSVYPLGGESSRKSVVELRGVNIGGKKGAKEEVVLATLNLSKLDKGAQSLRYTPSKSKMQSNEFIYNISDTEVNRTMVETEAGNSIMTATPIVVGETINARIESRGDEDWYSFDVKKAKSNIIIQLMARRLQALTDAKLTIYDSKGKIIKEVDDTQDPSQGMLTHHADPELSLKLSAAGRYYIRVTETQNQGGADYSYQLKLMDYQPDYILNIEPSSISIPQGGTTVITLFAQRKYNFRGKIDLDFKGLPEGFDVSATEYAGNAKSMKVAITAPMDAELGRVDLHVVGTSQLGKSEKVSREARPSQMMKQAFYIEHLLNSSEFRVDVTPADPFTISLEPMTGDVIQLATGEVPIRVVVHRKEGFNSEIQIMKKMVPQGMFFSAITIPEGESEGIINMECPFWNPKQKIARIMLLGTVKATTKGKVAGQARNSVNATVMVNSPYVKVLLPTEGEPVSREELRKLIRLKK